MSRKKKIEKNDKSLYILMIVLLVVLLLLMFGLLFKKLTVGSNYYNVESRLKKVSTYQFNKDPDYETVGWLRVQGTNIDYPIIYTDDQSKGYPLVDDGYVWTRAPHGRYQNVINLDGHNLYNLGKNIKLHSDDFNKLEELMDFVYYDFAKKNLYFQVTIDGKERLYKIFSVAFDYSYDSLMYKDEGYEDENELREHIDLLKGKSIYKYDVDVDTNDDIISIRTCSKLYGIDSNYDFIVSGRLLRKGESIDAYSIKRSKNYAEVDELLKEGDDYDEEENV